MAASTSRVRGSAFVTSVRIIFLAACPFYLGLAATAEPLVLTILGDKWAEAAPIVRLLALAMPLMTLQVLFSPACDAMGRPGVGVRNGAAGSSTRIGSPRATLWQNVATAEL